MDAPPTAKETSAGDQRRTGWSRPLWRRADAEGHKLVGAIASIVRSAAVHDKQDRLYRTFCSASRHAIENTRLLNELRESLRNRPQPARAQSHQPVTFEPAAVLDIPGRRSAARRMRGNSGIIPPRQGDCIPSRPFGLTIPKRDLFAANTTKRKRGFGLSARLARRPHGSYS
jgi:hypothetical protein